MPTNGDKLRQAAGLCGVLLNEATDVVRWFFLDNLPRSVGQQEPDLDEVSVSDFFIMIKS